MQAPGGMFLWHFPSGRPDWTLSSILLCGVRTFLELLRHAVQPAIACLPHIHAPKSSIYSLPRPVLLTTHGQTRYNASIRRKQFVNGEHSICRQAEEYA